MTATKARAAAKTILLLLGLAFGFGEVAARVAMLGASLQLLLYAALYGILAACLWGAAFIQSSPLRWAWATISLLTALLVDGFQAATAKAMSYDAFVSMLDSAGFLDDAFAQHGASIAHAAAGAFLLFFAIGIKPGPSRRMPGVVAILAPFAGLTILTALLFFRGGEGARGLPAASVGTSYATLYVIEAVAMPVPPRQPVRLIPKPAAGQGDIVLIIDESIAARYLDINDTAGVHSGLLSPPRDIAVSNFGIAASITNCSYGSNLTLRHGGTRGKYQRLNAAMPSIFDYAHTAGFRTTYIDAQRTGGSYQNGMDDVERRGIDHFVQFDEIPVVDRDMAAADALIALLNNGRRDFVLINKMGAHFPVADKYPASAATYQPALPRGETVAVTEMKLPENLFSGAEAWRLYRNSYRNTVAWTVGAFFDRIFAGAALDGALIVYTSDHGQNLHERGDPGTTTHCSPLPASEEGAVPLVVIGTAGTGADRWNAAAKQHFDASSHYRIFPTLLNAMGYDPKAVGRIYGETLGASPRDPATFNSLFNARLGRKPIWVEVRRRDLPRPPAGDFTAR
ncbi:lipid A ethanolaminephosphotransferase [Sphingopyxis panaciterrae]|uniref:sulfatase-like hydrolase/transferase n=1 Tax=Sphingopyxis panaciterrae TaxID=363841 RepID=UPI0014234AD1|nr:sulfatase-like hydrolase/transferase [Sphingopyxis panaciterrae]NIJ36630.1 lipid A ethanolaminephosphotransferase [Sphingopyxis panaciterrae]